jgi:hypothetical protein
MKPDFDPSLLVTLFTAFLALWPVACLLAMLFHSMARQWRRVGQVALLLPLWTIAASVGLLQVRALSAATDPALATRVSFGASAGIGFALCIAAVAWWLLFRSFGRGPSQPVDR